jgi:hypothetical protein
MHIRHGELCDAVAVGAESDETRPLPITHIPMIWYGSTDVCTHTSTHVLLNASDG